MSRASLNPFSTGSFDGVEYSYTCAEDRIRAAKRFDLTECEAALKMPNLQKTVIAALRRRLQHLRKVATVLHFTDHGQDFLHWELDANGKVIGCGPFQEMVWRGKTVLNHKHLQVGDLVLFSDLGESRGALNIRYPLKRVLRMEGGAA